jgi:glycine oxidase
MIAMNKVLIIGGGVIGLSIARSLSKKGFKEITILERGEIGKEASHAAAGMLAPHAEAEKLDDFFNLCTESLSLYPQFSEELFDETGINIELDKSGTLYLAFTENDVAEITKRLAWQQQNGLKVEHLSAQEVRRLEPFVSPDVREGLFFPNDWQVENRKLVAALRRFCELNKVEITENAEVTSLSKNVAETADKKYDFDIAIMANGAWLSLIKTVDFGLPNVRPIRGQMISFKTAKRLFSKVIYSPRGYIVPRKDGKIIAGASVEDVGFDNRTTDIEIEKLMENTFEISPSLSNLSVAERWSGLRPCAPDNLPILGEISGNIFIAAAHYRNGILLAPKTAELIAERITGGTISTYFRTFNPNRFSLKNNA